MAFTLVPQTIKITRVVCLLSCLFGILGLVNTMDLFTVKLVDLGDSKLIATSNYNYAMFGPKLLAKNWRTVSVNGDQVSIITTSGDRLLTAKSGLDEADRMLIQGYRDEIAKSNGLSQVSSTDGMISTSTGDGSRSMMMSSSSQMGASGSTSYRSYGNGVASSMSSGPQTSITANDMSISMTDNDNFSVSKSNLPFNWANVYFNGDLVTFVHHDGDVYMEPMSSLDSSKREAAEALKMEVLEMQKAQGNMAQNTMFQAHDMISNIFGGIMGRLPKPPDYRSSVGNMFGSSFPFGSDNSPFSSRSGWPLGGAVANAGNGAFAFAGARR